MSLVSLLCWAMAAILAAVMAWFAITSRKEREPRAERLGWILAILASAPYVVAAVLPPPWGTPIQVILLTLPLLVGLIVLRPDSAPEPPSADPSTRVDERDIMFARMRLRPGTPEYESYYAMRPELREVDDRLRARPGLLSPRSQLYEPYAMTATHASFAVIDHMRPHVDGPVASERIEADPEEMTRLIKGLARYWGAHSVGITELKDYHVYTHVGRGAGRYGEPIHLPHRYAIAFTVEMAYEMVAAAPTAPSSMESARQYLEAARVALQLAEYIRSLGYPARAHIDGNYRVIAPLVAWDAGLGEIGRMTLLMTPDLGPRVRINVVTTDLPLVPDQRRRDAAVIDFCRKCLKCAENCPSGAIPWGDPVREGDQERWKLDPVACYRYWATSGTDCAVCMRVCPFSHPDTRLHGVVRWALHRSAAARSLALALDDLFYARHPAPRLLPSWLPPQPVSPNYGKRRAQSRRRTGHKETNASEGAGEGIR